MDNFNSQTIDGRLLILDSPNVICECGCKTFVNSCVLKRISSLYSGTGKEELKEIPILICSECGKVPKELRDNKNFAKIFGEDRLSK